MWLRPESLPVRSSSVPAAVDTADHRSVAGGCGRTRCGPAARGPARSLRCPNQRPLTKSMDLGGRQSGVPALCRRHRAPRRAVVGRSSRPRQCRRPGGRGSGTRTRSRPLEPFRLFGVRPASAAPLPPRPTVPLANGVPPARRCLGDSANSLLDVLRVRILTVESR